MKTIFMTVMLILLVLFSVSYAEPFPITDPGTFNVNVDAIDCANQTPVINFSGDITLKGLTAEFIFKNNVKGTHELVVVKRVDVPIATSQVITFNKQPSLGGVGGNPWIYVRLRDSDGNVIMAPILLGRCVQLSK